MVFNAIIYVKKSSLYLVSLAFLPSFVKWFVIQSAVE